MNPSARAADGEPSGPGFARLLGKQAPRWQFILDDDGPEFQSEGDWRRETIDSGEWKANGPYFHDWGKCCHVSAGDAARATWTLTAPGDDTYGVEAWWPALPKNPSTRKARFEIVVGEAVLASVTLDQSAGATNGSISARYDSMPAKKQPSASAHSTGARAWPTPST